MKSMQTETKKTGYDLKTIELINHGTCPNCEGHLRWRSFYLIDCEKQDFEHRVIYSTEDGRVNP